MHCNLSLLRSSSCLDILILHSLDLNSHFHQLIFSYQIKVLFYNLQNLFLYGYGAIFNLLAILGMAIFKGKDIKDTDKVMPDYCRIISNVVAWCSIQSILSSQFELVKVYVDLFVFILFFLYLYYSFLLTF